MTEIAQAIKDGEIAKELKSVIVPMVNKNNRNYYESFGLTSLYDFGDDDKQRTADATKFISPGLTTLLKQALCRVYGFVDKAGDGSDIYYKDTPVEIKTTQATKSWTGNKHSSKVSATILISYTLDDTGAIVKIFFMFLDLDKCNNSKWITTSHKGSGFSGLAIASEDIDKGVVFIGKLDPLRKGSTTRNNKWCGIIRESV